MYYPAILFGPRLGQLVVIEGKEYIRIDSGVHFPVALLARKVHLFEGARVRTKHPQWGAATWDKPLDIGRVCHAVWYPDQREVRGLLEIYDPSWQRHVESVRFAGQPVGLSPRFYNIDQGPEGAKLVRDIREVLSLDLVNEPYSGARLLSPGEGIDIVLAKEAERLEKARAPVGYFKPLEVHHG